MSIRRPAIILRNVHVVSFTHRQWPVGVDLDDDSVALGYSTSFGCYFDQTEQVAAIRTGMELVLNDDDSYSEDEPYSVAELETVLLFDVIEDEEVDTSDPVALDFVANLIGIAYSTSRGVLIGRIPHERVEQSPAPAISPREVAEEMDLDWVAK